jgi:hypothetical protein
MKYRIIEKFAPWRGENKKDFIVQVKYRFLPFWIDLSSYGNNSFEDAKHQIAMFDKINNTKDVIHYVNIQNLADVERRKP